MDVLIGFAVLSLVATAAMAWTLRMLDRDAPPRPSDDLRLLLMVIERRHQPGPLNESMIPRSDAEWREALDRLTSE